MTAHQIARLLFSGPDFPVVIGGTGSDEGFEYEVKGIGFGASVFHAVDDPAVVKSGSPSPPKRSNIYFTYCNGPTYEPSDTDLARRSSTPPNDSVSRATIRHLTALDFNTLADRKVPNLSEAEEYCMVAVNPPLLCPKCGWICTVSETVDAGLVWRPFSVCPVSLQNKIDQVCDHCEKS